MISVASIRLQQVEMVSMSRCFSQYGVPQRVFRTFQFQTLLHSKDTAKSDQVLYVPRD
jgi:hypothetical protein